MERNDYLLLLTSEDSLYRFFKNDLAYDVLRSPNLSQTGCETRIRTDHRHYTPFLTYFLAVQEDLKLR